jgi:ATP-dependent RNA helicase DDX56/DBP9
VDKDEQDLMLLVEDDLRETYNYKSKTGSDETLVLFKPFRFRMDEIEGFRYRARDVLRSITSVLIKEARLKEIKNELLNSERLKSYFEENPREEQILRHDKELNVSRLDEHLRNVPEYIIPASLRGIQIKNQGSKRSKGWIKKKFTPNQLKFKVKKKFYFCVNLLI